MKAYYFPPWVACGACGNALVQVGRQQDIDGGHRAHLACNNLFAKPGGMFDVRACDNYEKVVELNAIEIELAPFTGELCNCPYYAGRHPRASKCSP